MDFIVFSKKFKEAGIEELAHIMKQVGADGVDLCVRPGYAVSPDNVSQELQPAVETLQANGLSVPMVTANFDFTDPDSHQVPVMFSALQQSGVERIKLGYYGFTPGETDYAAGMADIRQRLKTFESFAKEYAVTVCCHTHSGCNFGNTCAGLYALIKERDPKLIGAYVDTAHMFFDGEPWPMALSIIGEYLTIIGAKDGMYEPDPDNNGRVRKKVVPAGKGSVDWQEVFEELITRDFTGPVSIHGEYEEDFDNTDEFLQTLKHEIAYLRGVYQGVVSSL